MNSLLSSLLLSSLLLSSLLLSSCSLSPSLKEMVWTCRFSYSKPCLSRPLFLASAQLFCAHQHSARRPLGRPNHHTNYRSLAASRTRSTPAATQAILDRFCPIFSSLSLSSKFCPGRMLQGFPGENRGTGAHRGQQPIGWRCMPPLCPTHYEQSQC